ncbi:GNAT family N-acetyltransferase [Aquibacillus kalidii]|uniref:GNAT family N-acetyltransferase n=1 Tax=Aquibacillus kalidii TaxID=2762597 RepID=UPI001645E5FD|nr:GNAT family N-acetyltransferase [Aquibacillus kalidii]
MSLEFKEINKQNWEECIALSVSAEQRDFVAENSYSLLQSVFEDELYPLSIFKNDSMVGFLMYGIDPETNRMELCRLMIDKRYQKQGYGKEATLKLMEQLRENYDAIDFYTSAEPENNHALGLYEDIGFTRTGEVMWGEIVLKIKL